MTGPGRDWNKELAEIDKVMAKAPAVPPPAPVRAPAASTPSSAPAAAPARAGSVLAMWAKVLLGVVLAAAMTQWPYQANCGTPLFLFTGAAAMVPVAGVWAGLATWRRRMGFAHLLSLLVILWGVVLLAQIVLPRIGSAKTVATWWCA